MKIEITKQLVVDALTHENINVLRPGAWLLLEEIMDLEQCPRCAVGAVLLRVLDREQPVIQLHDAILRAGSGKGGFHPTPGKLKLEDLETLHQQARETVEAGHHMTALSLLFEGLCTIYGGSQHVFMLSNIAESAIERARQGVLEFVEKEFPATMVVDINGGQPAADVRVVEQ